MLSVHSTHNIMIQQQGAYCACAVIISLITVHEFVQLFVINMNIWPLALLCLPLCCCRVDKMRGLLLLWFEHTSSSVVAQAQNTVPCFYCCKMSCVLVLSEYERELLWGDMNFNLCVDYRVSRYLWWRSAGVTVKRRWRGDKPRNNKSLSEGMAIFFHGSQWNKEHCSRSNREQQKGDTDFLVHNYGRNCKLWMPFHLLVLLLMSSQLFELTGSPQ